MSTQKEAETWRGGLAYDLTFDCVQCGYCLPVCPTYESMGKETHSPRGRINLVKMAAEGKVDAAQLAEPIDLCLGCRNCETVCPTNVQYGAIWESAKEAVEQERKRPWPVKAFRTLLFRCVFPTRALMRLIGDGLWAYQKSGLRWLAHKLGILRLLPERLRAFEAITPAVASPVRRRSRRHFRREAAASAGTAKGTVAFFSGCIMDEMFHRTNRRTVALLKKAGYEVVIPKVQTCCGALQSHAGERRVAKALAKRNIEAFERAGADAIVQNAGGCGAMLAEYDELLADEPVWRERAARFVRNVRDVSELLAAHDWEWRRPVNEIVTYQPSCHMTNVQRITEEPLDLLTRIPGITYKQMARPEQCCGSAGIYNLLHFNEATDILDIKMARTAETEATTIVTTNPGCLLQMKLGVRREGLSDRVRVVHLVDLVAEAMAIDA